MERIKLRLKAIAAELVVQPTPRPAQEPLPDLAPTEVELVEEAKPVPKPIHQPIPVHRPPRREVTSVSPTGVDPQTQPKEVTIRLTRIIPPAPPVVIARRSVPAVVTAIILASCFIVGVLSVVGGAWGVTGTVIGLATGGIIHRWYSKGEKHG